MADFNVDVGQPQLNARPLQPVQDTSVAQGLNSLGNLFVDTGRAVKGAVIAGAANTANANNERILGSIQQNLIVKADVKDQIGWSTDRALRAVRRQFSSDIANHPELTKEIVDIYKSTLSERGLGGNLMEQSTAEKDAHEAKLALFKDAQTMGVVPAGMSPDDPKVEALLQNVQSYRLHETNLKAAAADLAYKRSQIGYQTDIVQLAGAKQSYVTGGITQQTARLTLAEKQAAAQGRAAVIGGATAFGSMITDKLSSIYNDFKSGKIPNAQDASMQMDAAIAQVKTLAQTQIPGATGEVIQSVLGPMLSLQQTYKDALTGKTTADALSNEVQATQNRMTMMMIHQNPKVLPYIATSKMFGMLPPDVQNKITALGLEALNYNSSTDTFGDLHPERAISGNGMIPSGNGGTQAVQPLPKADKLPDITADGGGGALEALKVGIDAVLSGRTTDPAHKEEVNRVIGTAIKSFGTYANTSSDPSELLPTIKLFADPSFGKYVKTNNPKVAQEDLDKAIQEFHHYYADAAIPLIRKEYVNSVYATGKFEPAQGDFAQARGIIVPSTDKPVNNIEPSFDGSRVTFIAKDSGNSAAVSEANKLNKSAARVLTTIVNAQSNLSNSSPREVYNQMIKQIVPEDTSNLQLSPEDKSVGLGS